ncbi:integral membrane protein DUF92-domain-containing protein [Fimicolochytrium jonesii]|uniref:integral membrane protein DUF92-domain-containing protein n=1 Tax=Fimicolochytrium jonesii TaxID=1396493 RepID=UPI0022FE509E|nr:integral membrane protein DUF92-domain-containing protein [Fimicolochytrium jonesii]KAI8822159.1 integral membrane protein DUF92-domain-containing protein [Fimicolochytrium jonesii]
MKVLPATALCAALAAHGLRKNSLSVDGAVAAVIVGFITFVCSGDRDDFLFSGSLLGFYLLGSRATKFKQERKKELEEDFQVGGQRNAIQVLANGLTGTIICALHFYLVRIQGEASTVCFGDVKGAGLLHTAAVLAYLGHYACCCGDTLASELGILNQGDPWLITTGKRVPRGTNGGISPLGLAASVGGGVFVGIIGAIGLPWTEGCPGRAPYLTIVALSGAAGLVGSLIDSMLGATLQKSVYNARTKKITSDFRQLRKGEKAEDLVHVSGKAILDNHQVNAISSLLTAVFTAAIGVYWYT